MVRLLQLYSERKDLLTLLFISLFFLQQKSIANPFNKRLIDKKLITELACNDWVNVSLDTSCKATVTLDMLLENIVSPSSNYTIQLWYKNKLLPSLNLDAKDHQRTYTFKVIHLPSGNSCWGTIHIEDKLAPTLDCGSDTLRCADDYSVESLGFPIPEYIIGVTMKPDPNLPNTYEMENWDACCPVTVSYSDEVQEYLCDSMFCKVILRHWSVIDVAGNKAECSDTIFIKRSDSSDIVIPRDFDGYSAPILKCYDNYIKLPNGNPSPLHTGHPVPNGCEKLVATYDDLKIDICPNSYKILRRWIVLDWCTKRVQEINQVIKVIDDKGPKFVVPDEVFVGMQSYTCGSFGKLPVPDSVVDCGSWTYKIFTKQIDSLGNTTPTSTQFIVWNVREQAYYIVGAPIGRIWAFYELTDACGNVSTKQMEIGVEDKLLPTPICDEKTVVTLGNDGKARVLAESFDDGSIDNCDVYDFKVRRMFDRCSSGSEQFRDYVDFCCADVGDSIQIILKVIDGSRNENTCMVRILVQEKEAPEIIAPTNITISCSLDRSNLANFGVIRLTESARTNIIVRDANYYFGPNFIAGRDGLATDNCNVSISELVDSSITCNQGYIRRTFVAMDRQGLTDTAIQWITISNPQPFGRLNINFPRNITINSCRAANTDPSITGSPSFTNVACAQVAATYEDKLLSKVDSSCTRILRTWTVLDWCQYNVQTNAGIWEAVQVIDIINSDKPDIYSCGSVEICDDNSYYDPVRKTCIGTYDLIADGDDDCTKDQFLLWRYRLDINNDGIFDLSGNSKRITGTAPLGPMKVEWTLEDQCGNISSCIQNVTIKDCKKPTPYCHNGIVTVIMPLNAQVSIWAKDFDINSSDNCTQHNNLIFSFSEDVKHTSITYNCDSMQGQSRIVKNVRMYVTDESGNQDYCDVQIILQDNNQVCGGTVVNIKGNITRAENESLKDVNIVIKNKAHKVLKETQTNSQGEYAFEQIALSPELFLEASKNDDPINGVSTYDIVMIQKNILGKQVFESPYQFLAADVNNSGSVTSRDISDLRKLILGIKDELPCNSTWNFVPKSYQFEDITNPWGAKSNIELQELVDDFASVNFVAYKKGDVDNSTSNGLTNLSSRNSISTWTIGDGILLNNQYLYPVYSNRNMTIEGFQFSLTSDDMIEIVSGVLEIEQNHFVSYKGGLNMSWNNGESIQVEADQILFYVKATKSNLLLSLNLEKLASELYLQEGKFDLLIDRKKSSQLSSIFKMGQNIPNPYQDRTMIPVEVSQSCSMGLHIYNLAGKLILYRPVVLEKGVNYIPVEKAMIGSEGIYLYKLEGVLGTEIRKMIVK